MALAIAREETADVLEAVENGDPAAAAPRPGVAGGTLRRPARALDSRTPGATPLRPPRGRRCAISRRLRCLFRVSLVVLGGALSDLWPVWVVGLVLVAVSTGLSRRLLPQP